MAIHANRDKGGATPPCYNMHKATKTAINKPAMDWTGPRVHCTLEIVTYEHEAIPYGQSGMSVGAYIDDLLDNAKDDRKQVGKVTLDFGDLHH